MQTLVTLKNRKNRLVFDRKHSKEPVKFQKTFLGLLRTNINLYQIMMVFTGDYRLQMYRLYFLFSQTNAGNRSHCKCIMTQSIMQKQPKNHICTFIFFLVFFLNLSEVSINTDFTDFNYLISIKIR